jgi:cytidine deaminase
MLRLVRAAQRARVNAYAPYSQFRVGASLLTDGGRVFVGCNVENATFGATICAERSAVVSMVAAGHRAPVACAVVTGAERPVSPCGICRQVLSEFAPNLLLIMVSEDERGRVVAKRRAKLGALFPDAFVFGASGGVGPRTPGRGPR